MLFPDMFFAIGILEIDLSQCVLRARWELVGCLLRALFGVNIELFERAYFCIIVLLLYSTIKVYLTQVLSIECLIEKAVPHNYKTWCSGNTINVSTVH